MEVAMSLNSLVRLPFSTSRIHEDGLLKSSLLSSHRLTITPPPQRQRHRRMTVVQAKGKKGMTGGRKFQRPPPSLPKIEDDGNPKFVIFTRMTDVYQWYPISIITGGATAKIIISAKDTFVGKYIYKDTLGRNLAAAIYKDEKETQKMAIKQHRVLRTATEFRYGYKLIEKNNLEAALSASDVIELPTPDKLKTVFDKAKDFFGDAKESLGKLTSLDTTATEGPEENSKEKAKAKS